MGSCVECCPVCGLPLPDDEVARQRHVNDCLDFGDGRDAQEAGEGEKEQMKVKVKVGPLTLASSYACPVCAKDLSAVSLTNRQAHVSRCCGKEDREEQQENPQTLAEKEREAASTSAAAAASASSQLKKHDSFVSSIKRKIEHNEKENSSLASNRCGNHTSTSSKNDFRSEHYWCRLCRKDLSRNTYEQRVAHVKKCSRQTAAASKVTDRESERERERVPTTTTVPAFAPATNSSSDPPIVCWLQSLGLERYRETFLREEISLDLVSSLTDSDLLTLGVTSLGARRKILTSVCALPIPSTTLKKEFAQLRSRQPHLAKNARKGKAAKVRNNRRITQYLGKKQSSCHVDVDEACDGAGIRKRKHSLIDPLPDRSDRSAITGTGTGTETATGARTLSTDITDIIGNSSLAICGNKRSIKSLWNYAGE